MKKLISWARSFIRITQKESWISLKYTESLNHSIWINQWFWTHLRNQTKTINTHFCCTQQQTYIMFNVVWFSNDSFSWFFIMNLSKIQISLELYGYCVVWFTNKCISWAGLIKKNHKSDALERFESLSHPFESISLLNHKCIKWSSFCWISAYNKHTDWFSKGLFSWFFLMNHPISWLLCKMNYEQIHLKSWFVQLNHSKSIMIQPQTHSSIWINQRFWTHLLSSNSYDQLLGRSKKNKRIINGIKEPEIIKLLTTVIPNEKKLGGGNEGTMFS